MTLPDYQGFMSPVLCFSGDNQTHSIKEMESKIADIMGLTAEERLETIPSGTSKVKSRLHWAAYYLKRAGLLESPSRGLYRITKRGQEVLKQKPVLNKKYLEIFPEFCEFLGITNKKDTLALVRTAEPITNEERTPDEVIQSAHQELRRSLADDLLERLRQVSPKRFEFIVMDLLVAMGYGGGRKRSFFEVTQYSNDGGIDGILKEDALGLDKVGVQAKRYHAGNAIGRDTIASFSGSLGPLGTKKGVFITTSSFTKEAIKQAERDDRKIILIDGEQLAQLMLDYGIGVSPVEVITLYRADSDYFDDI